MDVPCVCVPAIAGLHDFFAAWYRGEDTADLRVLEIALAPDFRLITPTATVVERGDIIEATRTKRGDSPSAAIRVEPVACTRIRGLHLSTYEEWQSDERTVRLSTAVLSTAQDGWRWHLVHETWLDREDQTG